VVTLAGEKLQDALPEQANVPAYSTDSELTDTVMVPLTVLSDDDEGRSQSEREVGGIADTT